MILRNSNYCRKGFTNDTRCIDGTTSYLKNVKDTRYTYIHTHYFAHATLYTKRGDDAHHSCTVDPGHTRTLGSSWFRHTLGFAQTLYKHTHTCIHTRAHTQVRYTHIHRHLAHACMHFPTYTTDHHTHNTHSTDVYACIPTPPTIPSSLNP